MSSVDKIVFSQLVGEGGKLQAGFWMHNYFMRIRMRVLKILCGKVCGSGSWVGLAVLDQNLYFK